MWEGAREWWLLFIYMGGWEVCLCGRLLFLVYERLGGWEAGRSVCGRSVATFSEGMGSWEFWEFWEFWSFGVGKLGGWKVCFRVRLEGA